MKLVKSNSKNELVQYPYSLGELRKEHPNVSFPLPLKAEDLASFNCFIVTEARPSVVYDKTAYDLVSSASLINGAWSEQWSLSEVDEEEKAERKKAELRNLDYKGFWRDFTRTASYAALKTAASSDLSANVLATELISVFSDAKAGNLDAEAMRTGIDETLSTLKSIDKNLATETEKLLASYGIDFASASIVLG